MSSDAPAPDSKALTFDVAEMTALLDGEHAAVRARVREILPAYASVLTDAE